MSLSGVLGCADPGGPLFPPIVPRVVWPPPPDTPRIEYIGQLRGEGDLHRPLNMLEALGQALSGPRPLAEFVQPAAVAVSGALVAVADSGSACVHLIDLDARTFRTARADLKRPLDLIFMEDRLAIADAERPEVVLLENDGRVAARWGRDFLQRPVALAWDADAELLWVLDAAQHALVAFDRAGSARPPVGGRGAGDGQFNFPAGLAILPAPGGTMLAIADAMNFRVQLLDAAGTPRAAFGAKGDAAGDFSFPRDVAADSDGNLYVLDKHFENVQIFDREGRLLMAFGGEGADRGQFSLPSGIAIDAQDRIWIADSGNRRVQVFQYLKEARR